MPRRKGMPDDSEIRFWSFVKMGEAWHVVTRTPCWGWTGVVQANGYSRFSWRGQSGLVYAVWATYFDSGENCAYSPSGIEVCE